MSHRVLALIVSVVGVAANNFCHNGTVCCWSSGNSTQYMIQDHSTQYNIQDLELIAVDTKTSSKKWGFKFGLEQYFISGVSCVVSGDDSTVYAARSSWDNVRVLAINAQNAPSHPSGTVKWTSLPKVSGAAAFVENATSPIFSVTGPVGGCSGFWSLDVETGRQAWLREPYGHPCPAAFMSQDGSTMYIGDGYVPGPFLTHGKIYGLDMRTGDPKWTFDNSTAYYVSVENVSLDGMRLQVVGYQCLIPCDGPEGINKAVRGMYVLDASSGKQIGSFTPKTSLGGEMFI